MSIWPSKPPLPLAQSHACYHNSDTMHAKQLTIRNMTPELSKKLRELSLAQGLSINAMVLAILRQVLDVNERYQALSRYVVGPSEDDNEFDEILAAQRQIDWDAWK